MRKLCCKLMRSRCVAFFCTVSKGSLSYPSKSLMFCKWEPRYHACMISCLLVCILWHTSQLSHEINYWKRCKQGDSPSFPPETSVLLGVMEESIVGTGGGLVPLPLWLYLLQKWVYSATVGAMTPLFTCRRPQSKQPDPIFRQIDQVQIHTTAS
jgi:hypothetical protein